LVASSRAAVRLLVRDPSEPDPSHPEIVDELRAIRQNLTRVADAHQRSGSRPLLIDLTPDQMSSVPALEDDLGPAQLRASAEACFRLSQGAVSRSLAEELEALGRAFAREADELER